MDAPDPAWGAEPGVQVLVAKRRAGVRIASHRRSGAVHDDGITHRRLSRPHPALVLLHAAPETRARMEPRRHLVVRHRHHRGNCRCRHRPVDVLAVAEISIRWRTDEHPVSRSETMAYGLRVDLRRGDGDLRVQRHALDGPVSVVQRSCATATWRRYYEHLPRAPRRARPGGVRREAPARGTRATCLLYT